MGEVSQANFWLCIFPALFLLFNPQDISRTCHCDGASEVHAPFVCYSSISRNIAGSHSNTEKARNCLTPCRSACKPQKHAPPSKLNSTFPQLKAKCPWPLECHRARRRDRGGEVKRKRMGSRTVTNCAPCQTVSHPYDCVTALHRALSGPSLNYNDKRKDFEVCQTLSVGIQRAPLNKNALHMQNQQRTKA